MSHNESYKVRKGLNSARNWRKQKDLMEKTGLFLELSASEVCRELCPQISVHASTQMSITSAPGALQPVGTRKGWWARYQPVGLSLVCRMWQTLISKFDIIYGLPFLTMASVVWTSWLVVFSSFLMRTSSHLAFLSTSRLEWSIKSIRPYAYHGCVCVWVCVLCILYSVLMCIVYCVRVHNYYNYIMMSTHVHRYIYNIDTRVCVCVCASLCVCNLVSLCMMQRNVM